MSKVYMSTPDEGYVIADRHEMPAEVYGLSGAMALDEAARILEDAEGRGAGDEVEWNALFHGHGRKAERGALAEALAAFVKDGGDWTAGTVCPGCGQRPKGHAGRHSEVRS